jgi:hypothetical protein
MDGAVEGLVILSELLKRSSWDSRWAKCIKGKVLPITGHEGPEGEYRYSSTLS